MEEENTELEEVRTSSESEKTRVGFPQVSREKPKSKLPLILIIVALLLLLGGAGWYLFGRSASEIVEDMSPTPTIELVQETTTPTPTEAEVSREGVRIQVLNGTGIEGGASQLKIQLEALGYKDVKVGNASPQNATATTVTFSPTVNAGVKSEITDKLESIYDNVTATDKNVSGFEVVITTGYPKGYKASATPATKTTTTPTKTLTPTGQSGTTTITPTKTPTPTP